MERVIEDLFAADDRGDFMQVRFWTYLKNKSIDACNKARRHTNNTESLDASYFGNGVFEGQTRLETEVDPKLSPEELAMISEELGELPTSLQKVFWLRHYVGMEIGPDDPAETVGDKLTIAAHFCCSGRTIRNWLKKATRLLASFREKHDGE